MDNPVHSEWTSSQSKIQRNNKQQTLLFSLFRHQIHHGKNKLPRIYFKLLIRKQLTENSFFYQPNLFPGVSFVILTLLYSLNSCFNPWIYLAFNRELPRLLLRHCLSSRQNYNAANGGGMYSPFLLRSWPFESDKSFFNGVPDRKWDSVPFYSRYTEKIAFWTGGNDKLNEKKSSFGSWKTQTNKISS